MNHPDSKKQAFQSAGSGVRAGALAVSEILFATDFSPASHAASLYARELATQLAVPLTVMHVFLRSESAQTAEAETGHASEQRLTVTKRLKATAEALSTPQSPAAGLLREGDPPQEIQRVVSGRPGVLLVLGTHGGSSIERHLLGSTAERVLTVVSCPTLTVGPKVVHPQDENLFKHVLYATDCSHAGSRAAPLAYALASRFSGQLRVISVIDEDRGPTAEILANFDFATREEFNQALQPQCTNFAESRSVSSADDAQKVILSALQTTGSDLLVLGVRQHDFLGLRERNSTAFQLIAKAPRPVLTITDRAFEQ